jgi:hypothetical protein
VRAHVREQFANGKRRTGAMMIPVSSACWRGYHGSAQHGALAHVLLGGLA